MLTTLSDEVWRLAKSKAFKLNALDFQPPKRVFGATAVIQFLVEMPTRWGQSEVDSKIEGIRPVSSKKGV